MRLTRQEKRFWSKVNKTKTCWLWTGAKSGNGFGGLRFNGRHQKAHRVAWELRHGPIPKGIDAGFQRLEVVQTCGVRICVRPDHLQLVPGGFTRIGRPQKVRTARGRPRKLTREKVVQIRELLAAIPYSKVASMFGVSVSTIRAIAVGRTWADRLS